MAGRNFLRGKQVEHLALRLLALFLAVVLWFLATERPQQTIGSDQRLVELEARVTGVDEGLEVTSGPGTVEATLEGSRLLLAFQAADVRAFVELSGLGPGRHQVPVRVEAPPGVTVRRVLPQEVSVTLEERVRRTVPVHVAVQGVPPEAQVRVAAVEPSSMEVYGAASAVERVAYILAQVAYDAAGSREVPAVAVAADGSAVEGVATAVGRVRVQLSYELGERSAPSAEHS